MKKILVLLLFVCMLVTSGCADELNLSWLGHRNHKNEIQATENQTPLIQNCESEPSKNESVESESVESEPEETQFITIPNTEPSYIKHTAVAGTKGVVDMENFTGLFDQNATTKWTVVSFKEAYVIWNTEKAFSPTNYTIVTGNDNTEYRNRNPKSWVLYGCNSSTAPDRDSKKWEVIDKVTNESVLEDKNYAAYNFVISKPSSSKYNYFKLEILKNHGDNAMQISEFALSDSNEPYQYRIEEGLANPSWNGTMPFPTIPASKTCYNCGGSGWRTCNSCSGKGYVEYYYNGPTYGTSINKYTHKDCPNMYCQNGQVKCSICGGDGER